MMSRRAGWYCWGCLFVTWCFPCAAAGSVPEASASPPTLASTEFSADRYFFDAKAKAAEQKWVEALALFERAWELKPSHDIAGNLGQVALKLGRYKKAATFLDRCLRLFPPTGSAEQRTQIQALFESARLHVSIVRLHADPQPGELVMDRVVILGPVGPQSEPIFVDPGTHIIQIRRDGRIVGERSFLAVANAAHDVNIGLESASTPVTPQSPRLSPIAQQDNKSSQTAPANEVRRRSALPIVVGASVSVAGFASSALLLGAAHSEVEKANGYMSQIRTGRCPSDAYTVECNNLHEANVRADTRYNWGYAMLGVGAAALLVTAGYVLWPTPTSGRVGSRVIPTLIAFEYAPGHGSLTWVGQF